MNILVSVIISALMVLGSVAYTKEKSPSLGASQTISSLTAMSSIDDADLLAVVDNSGTPTTKKITWGNATSSLEGYFDNLYTELFTTSAQLAGILSNETGTGVAVFNDTPTIGSPVINTPTFNVAGTDATGDTYYNGGSGLFSRLAIGSSGQFLMASTTGTPEWNNTQILTNPQTASSTFTATTTIEASNLTNKALVLNGLAYQWPSSRGVAGTVLRENGSGTLTFGTPIKISYAAAGPSVTTGYASTTLLTIPAGVMTASSSIRFSFSGTSLYNGVGGAWYLRNSSGATLFGVSCGSGSNGVTNICTATGLVSFLSASSQKYAYSGVAVSGTGALQNLTGVSTATMDFSGEITLIAVAYAPNASNDMNVTSLSVEVVP